MPPSRRARIGIANGWLSEEIPFIFRSDEQKMWNDAGGVFGLLSAVGTISGKIYLRRLRGSRFARAAEDNATSRRRCSGRSLRRPRPEHVLVSSFFNMVKCGATKIVYRVDRSGKGRIIKASKSLYLVFISRRNLRSCKASSTAASSTETLSAIGIEYHTPSVPQRSGSTSSSGTMKSI